MKLRNVIFYVKDINKSKDFYKSLSFKISQDFGKFVSFATEIENLYFSIMEVDSPDKIPGNQVCVFWAEDIKVLCQKLRDLGVFIETELYEAPFGLMFAIRDLMGIKSSLFRHNDLIFFSTRYLQSVPIQPLL